MHEYYFVFNLKIKLIITEMHLLSGRRVGSIKFITEKKLMPASDIRSSLHRWAAGGKMWQCSRNAGRQQWCSCSVFWSDTSYMAGKTTHSTKNSSGRLGIYSHFTLHKRLVCYILLGVLDLLTDFKVSMQPLQCLLQ